MTVSNFFKAFEYSLDSIDLIEEYKVAGIEKVRIQLHQSGSFLDRLLFLYLVSIGLTTRKRFQRSLSIYQ